MTAQMSGRVRILLLGGFEIGHEDQHDRVLRISSRKGRGLLAYLAMQTDKRASRERLASLFWGDRADGAARQSLRQCLLSLRRELAEGGVDVFADDSETVRLDLRGLSVDAVEFERAAAADASEGIGLAAKLYRGEFLAGLELSTEEFDEWVRSERTRLASIAAQVLSAAERTDAPVDGTSIIAMAERLVGLDPFNEDNLRKLLTLCARYRGRDAALVHANALAVQMRQDLDAEPEMETKALIERIRRGDVAYSVGNPPESGASPRNRSPSAVVSGSRYSTVGLAFSAVVGFFVAAGPWWTDGRFTALAIFGGSAPGPVKEKVSTPPDSWRSPDILPGAVLKEKIAGKGLQALMVLPFNADGSEGGPEQRFAEAISSGLTNDLSRVPTLRVIARQTARAYRSRAMDVATIGSELGVHYVVDGSLRIQNDRVRVDVALVDTKTSLQLWADSFERDMADRFAVQDEITRGLARRLQVTMLFDRAEQLSGTGGGIAEIDALLTRGWAAFFRGSADGSLDGVAAIFERALARSPGNSSARTGLAAVYLSRVATLQVPEPEPWLSMAENLLTDVIEQSPERPAAHYFLGLVHRFRGNHETAIESFKAALELNPSLAPAYAHVGHALTRLGRPIEGLKHIQYAIRLSPQDPAVALWKAFGGIAYIAQGDDDAALEWLTHALKLSPRLPSAHAALAAVHALRGERKEAAQRIDTLRALFPSVTEDMMMRWFVDHDGKGLLDTRFLRGLRFALERS